jgi:hypothetical protein
MPCDTVLEQNQTIEQRQRETKEALDRLERYLKNGTVQVKVGPQGAIVFQGWRDRSGVSAQAMSGKRVNPKAVASGTHSHDGGRTWSKH